MSKLYSLHDVHGTQARDNDVAIDYLAPPPIPTESGVREDDYEDDICVGDGCIAGRGASSHSHQVQDAALPIERQLEVVDMNNEDMDMLEWIVRKTIPIPKQYYWETGNTDLPRNVKIWHNVVGSMSGAVKWLDRVGKPVVDATGLTASRFDYVESTMTDRQKAMAIQTASARRLNKSQKSNRSLSYPEQDSASFA